MERHRGGRVTRQRLQRRARDLADFRVLTDAEAAAIVDDSGKVINERLVWDVRRSSPEARPTEVGVSVGVFNAASENLRLVVRIGLSALQRPHFLLLWGEKSRRELPTNLRRLDINDSHDNPDGERWRGGTHKHRWSVADGNAWAYTPDDIPVGHDNYREVFEAFTAECKITFGPDYAWADPPLDPGWNPQLWEVP
jgi:hypothetical protein